MRHPISQPDGPQSLTRFVAPRRRRKARVDERQLDILQCTRTRQQVEGLKNKTDFPITDVGQLIVTHERDIFLREMIPATRRCIETAQHIHHGGFAAARRPHDGEVLVAPYSERDAPQRMHDFLPHFVKFRDILNFNDHGARLTVAARSGPSARATKRISGRIKRRAHGVKQRVVGG